MVHMGSVGLVGPSVGARLGAGRLNAGKGPRAGAGWPLARARGAGAGQGRRGLGQARDGDGWDGGVVDGLGVWGGSGRDSVGALGLGVDPAGAARDAVNMVLSCLHRPLEPLAAPVTEERDATWDLRSSGPPATS